MVLPVAGAPGPACSNGYYQQLIGTYRGVISRGVVEDDGSVRVQCEWETEVVIRPRSGGRSCRLLADMTADVTQLVVLPATSPSAFQCRSDDSLRDLSEPYDDFETSEEYRRISFPVIVRAREEVQAPLRSPYFGDPASLAFNVWLLDGAASEFDFWSVDNDGTLTFVDTSPAETSRDTAVLTKVPQ